MALLTPQVVNRTTGQVLTTSAAAGGGDQWVNTGSEFFYVNNASGVSVNVTFTIPTFVDGDISPVGRLVTVAAGAIKLIGPFPTGLYNNPTTQQLSITYSAVTSVTVAIIRFTPAS